MNIYDELDISEDLAYKVDDIIQLFNVRRRSKKINQVIMIISMIIWPISLFGMFISSPSFFIAIFYTTFFLILGSCSIKLFDMYWIISLPSLISINSRANVIVNIKNVSKNYYENLSLDEMIQLNNAINNCNSEYRYEIKRCIHYNRFLDSYKQAILEIDLLGERIPA